MVLNHKTEREQYWLLKSFGMEVAPLLGEETL
jgi:hypothetical protein